MFLRAATLGVRFVFIFFLARYLDPASIGYYGLFTATIVYCLYIVGLDFYVYLAREIVRAPEGQRGRLLKGQVALSAMLYAPVLPITILILHHAGWPANLLWWLAPILLLEHVNQELFRLFVALSQQISASLLLFVRQASWAIAALALMTLDVGSRKLDVVMALWACAGAAAAVLGLVKLRRLRMGGWRDAVDWQWVRKGVAVSMIFLVATLSLRGVQTIDRYWFQALGGIEMVAAYVLFLGMTGALIVFLDAGVFSYAYPELIRLAHEGKHELIRRRVGQMLLQTATACVAFAICSWLVLPLLLDWVGNPVYKDAIHLYPWILTAMVINALGLVPHYALYAQGLDRHIICSHLAALPVFALSTWLVSMFQPVLAVPIGLSAAFTLILVWKAIAYWWYDRDAGAPKSSAGTS